MNTHLTLWNAGGPKRRIEEFVEQTTTAGSKHFVPPEERVAVFDNDGTLWCEKPMPIEMGFILERLSAMAEETPALRDRQPWQAAYRKDYQWLGDVVTKHYHGDDSDVKVLISGMLEAFEGMSVERYQESVEGFLQRAYHPTLKRRLRDCQYVPMVHLLRYLESYGFTNYIASGGERDFMRVVTKEVYGVPAERVVGSSNALCDKEGADCGFIGYLARPDVFDDGPVRPVGLRSRIVRRPILAFGNSNDDIQMLRFAGGARPALRLLLRHDDRAREFEYTAGAEHAFELARSRAWTVVSMRDDWSTVFAPVSATVRTDELGIAAS